MKHIFMAFLFRSVLQPPSFASICRKFLDSSMMNNVEMYHAIVRRYLFHHFAFLCWHIGNLRGSIFYNIKLAASE